MREITGRRRPDRSSENGYAIEPHGTDEVGELADVIWEDHWDMPLPRLRQLLCAT